MGTIVYTAYARGETDVVALDPGTTIPRRLTKSGSAYEPRWSQDGRLIVYVDVSAQSTSQVFSMRADASGARQVTIDTSLIETPAISPDGRRVAYACARRESKVQFHICIVNIDGGPSTLITPDVLGHGPVWSADGSLIAFACEIPGVVVGQV